MRVVHPIERAWLSTGGTGAQNYDEFADDAEITPIIEANPRSALAIEMPHRAPESLGSSFTEALPAAVSRLEQAKQAGAYRLAEQVVVPYRISAPATADVPAQVSYGMFAMVDTDQISTSADEPGLVIRNEEVFLEKVRERVALAEATNHLLSPVLLLQTGNAAGAPPEGGQPGTDQRGNGQQDNDQRDNGQALHDALIAACAGAGEPVVTDVDPAGRTHEIWHLDAQSQPAQELCALASAGELVVADGNHRSLAAQTGDLRRFLAVITTPASVTIQPYHRLITEVPYAMRRVAERCERAGVHAEALAGVPELPPPPGVAYLYTSGGFIRASLPTDPDASLVDNLDHALVERMLIRVAFGLDPGDKRVIYVGGDYPVSWLCGEVDAGRAEVAVVVAPVSTEEFVAVNLARQKMPRKSTWFTPKARAGLVLAEIV